MSVTTRFALLGLAIASPLAADASPRAADDDQRIEFAPGTDYGSVAGATEAGGSEDYVLRANAGQMMTVVVASVEQNAAVSVIAPDGAALEPSGGPVFVGTLPATGDYRLEVSGLPDLAATTYGLVVHIAAPAAAPSGVTERIEFAAGTDSASVDGAVVIGTTNRYVLAAAAGQSMSVEVSSVEGNAVVDVLAPDGSVLADEQTSAAVQLPVDGDYVVEVGSTRGNATYTLGITITGPAPTTTAAATPAPACGVDPQAPEIGQAVASVPVPEVVAGASWVYSGESNFDRCAALSYARLDTEGGTGSSPVQLMLFHNGVFVGTATDCAFGFTSVDSSTADSITVTYRWPRDGDTNAAPSGEGTVTYRWSGDAVVMDGELPAELLQLTGCAG
jgi:hypothetical protein